MTLRTPTACALALSLFVCACSDGTTLTPRAAVRISVNAPQEQGQGRQCMFGPHEGYVGGDSASKLPDAYNFGTRLVDEENGTSISCRVTGKETFRIRGTAERAGVLLTVTGEVPNAEFEDSQNGEGEVQVRTTSTAGQSLVPLGPCRLTPVKVAAGRVWAEFYCPNMEASRQQNTFCSASGFFVFENCER